MGRRAAEDPLLLIDQRLERALRGFLPFQEAGMEQSSLLLYLLKGRHAFLRRAQRVGG